MSWIHFLHKNNANNISGIFNMSYMYKSINYQYINMNILTKINILL